jgi:histidyl-tRNA synthetase
MNKPGIPQGTRDFSAETVNKRNFILNTIRKTFVLYGFQPLETPAMENLDTLMGKYGEEGDKLIFKILNNGLNDPKNHERARSGFEKLMDGKSTADLTERALKYDLTIPFARYVAMNHTTLTFPYKRYQVQNVWRADRPQKGRYREFTQCDADIVGSTSLLNEIEFANMYHDVFTGLGLSEYNLKVNNRKILLGLAELCGDKNKIFDITVSIDKLEKTGIERVREEFIARGLTEENIKQIEAYLQVNGTNEEKLDHLRKLFPESNSAKEGIEELSFLVKHTKNINLEVDVTLARGLNYYTGIIFEPKAPLKINMGSIGGGGRYDDLTGLFGVDGIAGVGISFGVDRIYDVLEELKLFPADLDTSVEVLFFNMGADESIFALTEMQKLRQQGISTELFHEHLKMDKQFRYAERKKIPFVIFLGSQEISDGVALVKNLKTGDQEKIPLNGLPLFFKKG